MFRCPFCIKTAHPVSFDTAQALAEHRRDVHPEHEPPTVHPEAGMSSATDPAAGVLVAGETPTGDVDVQNDPVAVAAALRDNGLAIAAQADRVTELRSRLDTLTEEVARLINTQTHFTSELGAIRESFERLDQTAAQEAAGAGRLIADVQNQCQRVEESAGAVRIRLEALEQLSVPSRVDRIEQHLGLAQPPATPENDPSL